jgi:hypothetical protein
MPLLRRLAVWYFPAAGKGVVSTQVLGSVKSSALLNTVEPSHPPTTTT